MRLTHRDRAPGIEPPPVNTKQGFEHLRDEWLAVLQWLAANGVDYVLVGAVAQAIRAGAQTGDAVSIVPAPYGRNLERLARALGSAHVRLRVAGGTAPSGSAGESDGSGTAGTVPVKVSAEKLAGKASWTFRCGTHDLDVEGRSSGVPRYQELLYEARRFELAPGLSVEVASLEDLEHYAQLRRTGVAPEIRISRLTTRGQGAQ